ncbi:PKD domain-containing protein [Haloglomus litoreum]|uniref:PKD domain-containing protein n=1 Tax=Haloglomus litoreum TaxID=3034026 RepID=UPI0023E832D5|nr:PKD domain-containing protein [Haloglomus sp. DT116]
MTVLHPDRVLSVTAGGLNGMTLLPLTEAKGERLDYHVGIADVSELTGESVDLDALDRVNQLLYMGSQDENDTIPFDDAWTSDALRETALAVYGEDMIADRFPFCQAAYERADVSAQFTIVDGVGHRPLPVERLTEFHRRSMAGEDVSDFGEDLTAAARAAGEPSATFTVTTEGPMAGEPVAFDAAESHGGGADIVAYTWEFGDGGSAAGASVTHRFDTGGSYSVRLRVVNGDGETSSTTRDISVERAPRTGTGTDSPRETTVASGPGFGVGAALVGLGAGGVLAHRRCESRRE